MTREDRVVGVLRLNTRIRHELAQTETGITLGEVAQTNFTFVREGSAVFGVISRMSRQGAAMAIVIGPGGEGPGAPSSEIRGIITKERISDLVAKTVEIYSG